MSSVTELLVFSRLPAELLRDIFEHAAASDPKTAYAMSLVSTAVRYWTEPILYHTVVLSSSRSVRAFLAAISNKPNDFVPTRVKHLGVFALGPLQSIGSILSACRGVRSLACGFNFPGYKQLQGSNALRAMTESREQHLLALSCRDGWDTALVVPSITHLRIHITSFNTPDAPFAFAFGTGNPTEAGWERLSNLSSLTHLAIVYRHSPCTPPEEIYAAMRRLLAVHEIAPAGADPPRLRLVLLQVLGGVVKFSPADAAVESINQAAVHTGGPSLCIVAERAPTSMVRQWEAAVRGGPGIWEGAEEVVNKRLVAVEKGEQM